MTSATTTVYPVRPGRSSARGAALVRALGPTGAAATVVAALAGAFDTRAAAEGLFAAAVLIGLPHGAADHVAVAWAAGRPVSARAAALTGILYAAGVALGVIALVASPAAAVCAVLAVSAWHFGTSDRDLSPDRPRRARAADVAFGVVVVAGPLALWPRRSAAYLTHLSPQVASGVRGPAHAALLVLVAAAASAGGAALWQQRRTAELAELAVLTALVVAAPPAAAVGVYFGLWHSPRHIERLVRAAPAGDRRRRRAFGRLAEWSVPTSGVAVGAVLAVWAAVPTRLWPVVGLAALLAVSVPHSVVVAHLDRTLSGRGWPGGAAAGPAGAPAEQEGQPSRR